MARKASDAVRTVSDRTAEIAGRARVISDGVAERARMVSAVAGATFEKAKRPFTSDGERDGRAVEGALEAMHREREEACTVRRRRMNIDDKCIV